MLATLKRHWLLFTLALIFVVSFAVSVQRCSHTHGSGKANSPSMVTDPAGDATATTTAASHWTDPTTIGTIVTAVLSAIGVVWRALKSRNPAAVIDAIDDLRDTMKDTLKNGVPLSPSVEKMAADLHEAGREAVLKGQTIAREQGMPVIPFTEWDDCSENVKEGRRVQARWLLAKYTITVKP